jgi:hypothetical protein
MNRQVSILLARFVARVPDGIQDSLGFDAWRGGHLGPLSGEINRNALDALDGADGFFHAPHARGAGHSRDGDAESLRGRDREG